MIYLDNNATTPVDKEVQEAICTSLEIYGNPSSSHIIGKKTKEIVEAARVEVASLIGAKPDEIIFTSGGTESNNLAIVGYCQSFKKGHVISSMIEHPSVINPLLELQRRGVKVTLLKPDRRGIIYPEDVKRNIRKDTILVSIMHANNETGVIQPIEEIAEYLKETEIVFHTDAAQSVGKIPVDVKNLGVDMLTVVSHKFYGPKGVGALYVREGISLRPVIYGAGQERGLSPGTENVPGIVGLGKAAEIARRDMKDRVEYTKEITEELLKGLISKIGDIKLNGAEAPRLPNTLNITIKGIISTELVESLKEEVAISSGSACHAGVCKPSDVLIAMGLSRKDALSSVRISTGKDNTSEEIDKAIELISEHVRRLRKKRGGLLKRLFS